MKHELIQLSESLCAGVAFTVPIIEILYGFKLLTIHLRLMQAFVFYLLHSPHPLALSFS